MPRRSTRRHVPFSTRAGPPDATSSEGGEGPPQPPRCSPSGDAIRGSIPLGSITFLTSVACGRGRKFDKPPRRNGGVALELAARKPDTTSCQTRLPTQMTAKARTVAHCGPRARLRLSWIQALTQGSTPDSHHLEWTAPTTPGCRCLTAPAPLEGPRIQGPGTTGLKPPRWISRR